MNTDVDASSAVKSRPVSPPRLRPARFDDYERIVQLGLAHSFEVPLLDDWRHLWVDNPLWQRLGKHWPIGWVLETAAGEIVGSTGNVPLPYKFRGEDIIAASGRAWSVKAPYRGLALWLMDEHFNQPNVDLFVETSIGPMAAAHFSELCARIPLGNWAVTSYWITEYHAFARHALKKLHAPLVGLFTHPAAATLKLKDAVCTKCLPKPSASVNIESLDRFDSRFDAFWNELVRQNPDKLLADRSRRALSWHFAVPLRKDRLWILAASKNQLLRAYCVFKREDNGQGIRRMRLVDYQNIESQADLLPNLLHAALARCALEDICVLENLGVDVPKMRAFDEFAPHHRKLGNWPFFYRAADPLFDAELRQPKFWDPSVYDGDASV